MWSDPIVDEIRAEAKKWSDQFNGDIHAMFEELRRLERVSGREILSLPPRPAVRQATVVTPLLPTDAPGSSQPT